MAPVKAASATERSTFSVSSPAFLSRLLAISGIVGVLRLRIDGELDGRRDRVVVADRAVAEEHLLDDLLAVERILDRLAHIDIVEGRRRDVHHVDVVAVAGHLEDHDIRDSASAGRASSDRRGADSAISPVFSALVRAVASVIDEHLDLVEPGLVRF